MQAQGPDTHTTKWGHGQVRRAGRTHKPAVFQIRSAAEGLSRGIERDTICVAVMLIAGLLGSITEEAALKAEWVRQAVKGLPSKFSHKQTSFLRTISRF